MKRPLLLLLLFVLMPSAHATNSPSIIALGIMAAGPFIAVGAIAVSLYLLIKCPGKRIITIPLYAVASMCLLAIPFYFDLLGASFKSARYVALYTRILYLEVGLIVAALVIFIVLQILKRPNLNQVRIFCIVFLLISLLFVYYLYSIASYVLPYNALDCDKIPEKETAQQECYMEKALLTMDPSLCEQADRGSTTCLHDLVHKSGDIDLCREYFSDLTSARLCHEEVLRMQGADCVKVAVNFSSPNKEFYCAQTFDEYRATKESR